LTPVVIGPPAPVPPEVAIPRPTPAELAQINETVKKWIDSDKSPAKPLLTKFEIAAVASSSRLNVAATYTQTAQRMGLRHEGSSRSRKKGDIDLLLHETRSPTGDARRRQQGDVREYFGEIKTANFASPRHDARSSLGLKNGEGQGFQPKASC